MGGFTEWLRVDAGTEGLLSERSRALASALPDIQSVTMGQPLSLSQISTSFTVSLQDWP